jgi:hypothetical protein
MNQILRFKPKTELLRSRRTIDVGLPLNPKTLDIPKKEEVIFPGILDTASIIKPA